MAAANDENGFAVPALRCGRPVSGLLDGCCAVSCAPLSAFTLIGRRRVAASSLFAARKGRHRWRLRHPRHDPERALKNGTPGAPQRQGAFRRTGEPRRRFFFLMAACQSNRRISPSCEVGQNFRLIWPNFRHHDGLS